MTTEATRLYSQIGGIGLTFVSVSEEFWLYSQIGGIGLTFGSEAFYSDRAGEGRSRRKGMQTEADQSKVIIEFPKILTDKMRSSTSDLNREKKREVDFFI